MVVRTNPMLWTSRGRSDRAAGRRFEVLMAMKFGQITKGSCEKNFVLVVSVALALLAGCQRDSSNLVAMTADANSTAPNAQPKTSSDTNPTGTYLKVQMVQIAGGRVRMGDKNEVDAPLHEVVVS